MIIIISLGQTFKRVLCLVTNLKGMYAMAVWALKRGNFTRDIHNDHHNIPMLKIPKTHTFKQKVCLCQT